MQDDDRNALKFFLLLFGSFLLTPTITSGIGLFMLLFLVYMVLDDVMSRIDVTAKKTGDAKVPDSTEEQVV